MRDECSVVRPALRVKGPCSGLDSNGASNSAYSISEVVEEVRRNDPKSDRALKLWNRASARPPRSGEGKRRCRTRHRPC